MSGGDYDTTSGNVNTENRGAGVEIHHAMEEWSNINTKGYNNHLFNKLISLNNTYC